MVVGLHVHYDSVLTTVTKEYDLIPKKNFRIQLDEILDMFEIPEKDKPIYTLQIENKSTGAYLDPDKVTESVFKGKKVLY